MDAAKRILVATDGSAGADRAVTFGSELAIGLNARLTIVTVSDIRGNADLERFSRTEGTTLGDVMEAEAQAILGRACAAARAKGAEIDKTEALTGDATELILEAANQVRPLLVAVGKRGRGRLEGLLLGSVSQKLISLSRCPVIVVP